MESRETQPSSPKLRIGYGMTAGHSWFAGGQGKRAHAGQLSGWLAATMRAVSVRVSHLLAILASVKYLSTIAIRAKPHNAAWLKTL